MDPVCIPGVCSTKLIGINPPGPDTSLQQVISPATLVLIFKLLAYKVMPIILKYTTY